MSGDKKLVSIIIPCYNYGNFVSEAINSALNQTYGNIQIVVVNDGSTDNSGEVIKTFADKYKNILFFDNKENNGVVYSRNMAIEASSGYYILPLDADDFIDKTYVEKAVKIFDTKPEIGIVYCNANLIGNKNKKWKLPEFDKEKMLYENCIFASAIFRKEDFIRAGKYKDYMKNGIEDWDLWLSFMELGIKPYKINETLFYYRQHSFGSRNSNINSLNLKREILKQHKDLYLNSEEFIERAFSKNKNYKKYRKLFNIFLFISIIEFLGILFLIWRINT